MEIKKLYPHTKTERLTLLGRPEYGRVKRLMERVNRLNEDKDKHPELPINHFLKDLDKSLPEKS